MFHFSPFRHPVVASFAGPSQRWVNQRELSCRGRSGSLVLELQSSIFVPSRKRNEKRRGNLSAHLVSYYLTWGRCIRPLLTSGWRGDRHATRRLDHVGAVSTQHHASLQSMGCGFIHSPKVARSAWMAHNRSSSNWARTADCARSSALRSVFW